MGGLHIAAERQIACRTVEDKYIRGLRPDINRVSEFDAAVQAWLFDGVPTLKRILLKHAVDEEDPKLIRRVFSATRAARLHEIALVEEEFGPSPTATEGRRTRVTHLRIERNRRLVQKAKTHWRKTLGALKCRCCGFDFSATYGALGEGFIEAHHLIPLSELDGERQTTLEDLAPVCANCHRMLHRKQGALSIGDLQDLLRAHRTS